MWSIEAVAHVKGLAHSTCSTDTGDYFLPSVYWRSIRIVQTKLTLPILSWFLQFWRCHMTQCFLCMLLFPHYLLNALTPLTSQAASYFPLLCFLSLQVKISLPLSPSDPSLEKHRIQICKDMNELCGDIFLTFKILTTVKVNKFMQWVI